MKEDQAADLSAKKWNEAWEMINGSFDMQWLRAVCRCAENSFSLRLVAQRRLRVLSRLAKIRQGGGSVKARQSVRASERQSVEILIACPICGRRGFSVRGLRAHFCRAKADRSRLTLTEYKAAIDNALKPIRQKEAA